MKKELEYKLCEFRDKRLFANGRKRKEFVDGEVVNYLVGHCPVTADFIEAQNYYKSLYQS
jgi:hypothetical protein